MIEILVPTLTTLHPLSVVNSIHSSCINKVEAANILKRDQSLSYWSQVNKKKVLLLNLFLNFLQIISHRFIQIQNDQQPSEIYKDPVDQL